MKKLAAFTLLELMITLVISSVIIGIAFGAWSILNTQFNRYRSRTSEIRTFRLLSVALQRDINRAERVTDTLDDQHVVLVYPDTVVYYSFQPNECIRMIKATASDAIATDTFAIQTAGVSISYLNDSLRLIGGFTINIILAGEQIPLPIAKSYSAQQIMATEDQSRATQR